MFMGGLYVFKAFGTKPALNQESLSSFCTIWL